MATFYPVTANEFRDLLKKEKGWTEEIRGQEIVFNYLLVGFPFIQIKVYSGIRPDSGQSKGCGQDAIRVCSVDIRQHKGFIKTKRVHRVTNWSANLKARVLKVIEQSKARLRDSGVAKQVTINT